jgi:hypothetical protein
MVVASPERGVDRRRGFYRSFRVIATADAAPA